MSGATARRLQGSQAANEPWYWGRYVVYVGINELPRYSLAARSTTFTESGSWLINKLAESVYADELQSAGAISTEPEARATLSSFTHESAEEATRMSEYTGIAFRGPDSDRRAWAVWAGLDIWEIIEAYKMAGYEAILEEGQISKRVLDLALSYYSAYPEEIDRALSENQISPQEWHELFPDAIPPPNAS